MKNPFKIGELRSDVQIPAFRETLSRQILKTVNVGDSFLVEPEQPDVNMRKFIQLIQKRFALAAQTLGMEITTRVQSTGVRIWRTK
jgi:hypothetical protein